MRQLYTIARAYADGLCADDEVRVLLARRESDTQPKYYLSTNGEKQQIDYSPLEVPRMTVEAAHELANWLWQLGIRPRAAAGSAGQLDAVIHHRDHLERLLDTTLSVALMPNIREVRIDTPPNQPVAWSPAELNEAKKGYDTLVARDRVVKP